MLPRVLSIARPPSIACVSSLPSCVFAPPRSALASSSLSLPDRFLSSTPTHLQSPEDSTSQQPSQPPRRQSFNTRQSRPQTTPAVPEVSAFPSVYPTPPSVDLPPNPTNIGPLYKRLIHVRRVVRQSRAGKVRRMWAMVVVGNRNGAAGVGEGKATELNAAVQKAIRRAVENMAPVARYENRTLWHDVEHTFNESTRVRLWARAPGHGLVANPHVHTLLTACGVHDCASKVTGSTNPMNVVKAAFEALGKQKTADEVARARGRKVVDVQRIYYGGSS
ncbi:hypothetical protein M427DRAFT_55018 [Gonapodya prolifera JEL478]|uniref:Small ribosomal subunit protein uS5m n=1 Tax=Gonapodya prolifera (strain JEL478) TaxID=1344416 RepID=A0A139AKF8_GONPJ|nr:hypothetical protein M427DRAFT_55018 [Gonapodya prolifera JEL478]|eukprot:KXS16993.1 hypothetical protein M427DRAFT_55018 [Gonapodya prolifera JEL478]